MINSLTIIADSNIAQLTSYFNDDSLHTSVNLIQLTGREITAEVIKKYQPDILLVRSVTKVDSVLLADNDSVTFVASATIGTDHIDQAYLQSKNITFANASGCSKHSVAQYVITAILTLQPNITKQPTTLGIIGLGNIGSCLANYAHDLGWQVVVYDPFVQNTSMVQEEFEALLQHADIVSLHVPLTTSEESIYPTYHLIDKQALAMMKPDAMLINTARGKVVEEMALLADIADTNRQVVLDVFEHEPIIDGRLLDKLAIATPHIAGYTLEGKLRGTQMIYEACCTYFNTTVNKHLDQFLPDNPYYWQSLLQGLSCTSIAKFYPIIHDDQQLRKTANHGQVSSADFDSLRKHYPLRREWQLTI